MLAVLFVVQCGLSLFVQGEESTLLILRFVSIFGLLFSVIGLILIARIPKQVTVTNSIPQVEPEEKSIFVEIYDQSIMQTTPVIDLENLDDLVRIAERHKTVVFHLTLNFIHLYYVHSVDNITYRYVLSIGTKGIQESFVSDGMLENTLPNQIPDRNPYPLIQSKDKPEVSIPVEMEETQSPTGRENDTYTAPEKHKRVRLPAPNSENSFEYVLAPTRIEFTESNYQ